MLNIQKLKDEAFAEALEELKKENADDLEILKKLERYENGELRINKHHK